MAIAAYLTWIHYADAPAVCVGGGGGCDRVQASDYAQLAGVPVALIGLVGYGSLLAAFTLRGPRASLAAAFLALVGFGFSAYLTYVELFVINAICQWCVASAALITALAAIAIARYLSAPG
jgi:uncharacterized membrane protein